MIFLFFCRWEICDTYSLFTGRPQPSRGTTVPHRSSAVVSLQRTNETTCHQLALMIFEVWKKNNGPRIFLIVSYMLHIVFGNIYVHFWGGFPRLLTHQKPHQLESSNLGIYWSLVTFPASTLSPAAQHVTTIRATCLLHLWVSHESHRGHPVTC